LRYIDVRRFGQIRLLAGDARETTLGKLGLDPLEATEAEFRAMLRGRRARIKALLLDQRFLRGMGNIYTDESLWRARINPKRLGANLNDKEIRLLYRSMREVLTEAIKSRGSSVSNYVDACGERGNFQTRHRVYQRKGKKCFRCGTLIQRAIVAGRSSYLCPGCQKAPRARAKRP
jgi:formamidopyrimidine-DNA glycosylase